MLLAAGTAELAELLASLDNTTGAEEVLTSPAAAEKVRKEEGRMATKYAQPRLRTESASKRTVTASGKRLSCFWAMGANGARGDCG